MSLWLACILAVAWVLWKGYAPWLMVPCRWVIRRIFYFIIAWSLKGGWDPTTVDAKGCTFFHLSAHYGHPELVKMVWNREVPYLPSYE